MALRSGGWEAPWITKSARRIRNVFYITMFSLLGVYFVIRHLLQIKMDGIYFLVIFFSLYGGGLWITITLERKVKRAARVKRAEEYIAVHPELDPAKKDGLMKGLEVDGMSSEEREIATGLIQYDNPPADETGN